MADGAKTSKVANVGGFLSKLIPKPSIDIVKFWQGIVEIAVRVALLVRLHTLSRPLYSSVFQLFLSFLHAAISAHHLWCVFGCSGPSSAH